MEEILIITNRKQKIKGLYNSFINKDLRNGFHPIEKSTKFSDEFIKQYENLFDIFEPFKKPRIFYILSKIKIPEKTPYIIIEEGIYIYFDDFTKI